MNKALQFMPVMALATTWPHLGFCADSQAELAKQSLNPVAALYSVPIQYNLEPETRAQRRGLSKRHQSPACVAF